MPIYKTEKLLVRTIKPNDVDLIAKWLSDPQVLEFYEGRDNPFDTDKVKQKFLNRDDKVTRCLVEYDGVPIGYIQFYPIESDERVKYGYEDSLEIIFGTDQFIGEPEYWNQGIGTLLVQSMFDYLVNQKQANRIVMDPQTWNERAIATYEKCGMKKVKLLPENEWHEGEYRDCWLMEYTNKEKVGEYNETYPRSHYRV
ncbi:GNAT family N-acetyltransferase [Bacillus carboniphilus]|uniref:GNAT family N-acetyltransferase n=1 Tax=Bacillus carboniphilus TaxID=86663 RepID=A0ABP3FDI7_9BACI